MPSHCAATRPKFLNVPLFLFQTLWPFDSRDTWELNITVFNVFLFSPLSSLALWRGLVWFVLRCSGHANSGYWSSHVYSIRWQIQIGDTIHFSMVWFVDVLQNLGFEDPRYVLLRQIRANFCFGFLFCTVVVCEYAPTLSRNLVFQRSLSCPIDSRISMFLMMTKNCLTSA